MSTGSDAPKIGLVVANHGRHLWVEDGVTHQRLICRTRGKKAQAVVGDRVHYTPSEDEGVIDSVAERKSLLYRQDELRTKQFAANLDLVVILLAAEPVFSEHQLARALIACKAAGIEAMIVLNKQDLTAAFALAWARLAPYLRMGYAVHAAAFKPHTNDPASALSVGPMQPALPEWLGLALANKTSLVLGPSGVGKSTLVNCLLPDQNVYTREISTALNSGKHTTTATQLYWLSEAKTSALIDSPGFQEFGLQHIAPTDLATLMPDFSAHLGLCKFYNCTHLHEPSCKVREQLSGSDPSIAANRYKIYRELFDELSVSRH